jgi:uncharacterized glyoxalase superfamily protein PhnB/uncharacterized protein YndB with AHSA1/START domain
MDNSKQKFSISRTFNAPKAMIFDAFSNPEALAKWWGPVEAPIDVIKLDFKVGGTFHYRMNGKQINYGIFNYKEIDKPNSITWINSFANEKGEIIKPPFEGMDVPREILNKITLTEKDGITTLLLYSEPVNASESEISTFAAITEGMEKGYGGTLNQLEHYLKTQISLIKQLKTTQMARVSTYLNFPGNTEEAFNFYKKIFRSEFAGEGIKRFGDIEAPEGMPPMSDEHKKLIIHIQLPILGGHVLMATDAPESMGFKLEQGTNMHINLEPDSKEETKRLYDALSDGGKVTMELQDMFWGDYLGTCTDKYGINWMFNYSDK